MIATKGQPQLAIGGVNQQDFQQIQMLSGGYPYQIGLQKRVPGKTLERALTGPIGSIYVFYMVHGRTYRLIDFGTLQIDPIGGGKPRIPGFPPIRTSWFDNFADYEDDLISKFWGAGAWPDTVGVCEAILLGFMDAFRVSDTVTPIPVTSLPRPGPDIPTIPDTIPNDFPIGGDKPNATEAFGGNAANGPNIVGGFSPPFTAGYAAYMESKRIVILPHPYDEIDPTGKRFKGFEDHFSNVGWGGFGGTMTDSAQSQGYFTVNRIFPTDYVANPGDTVVLTGTLYFQTGGDYASPVMSSRGVNLILGVYPDIPEYVEVVAPPGETIKFDGTYAEGSAITTLIYDSYLVYPPEDA